MTRRETDRIFECRGCRCETCRWKGAGSLCHYNEHGQDTSRCSWCMEGVRQEELAAWKVKSFSWRRYMKKIDLYQCEVCGTQFKNKEDCVKCEKGHTKELKIVKSRYLPFTQDGSGMPTTITLMGPDGRHYTYKR